LENGEVSDLRILLHIHDPKVAHWMGEVMDLFRPKKEHVDVKALLLKEVDDRPSTYFFAELHKTKDDINHLTKKTRAPLLEFKESLEHNNAAFNTKTLITANAPFDVCEYLHREDISLAIFELKQDIVFNRPLMGMIHKSLKKNGSDL